MITSSGLNAHLRRTAAALVRDFPMLSAERVAQAIVRAEMELDSGYRVCLLDRPSDQQSASEVVALARQELERVTDTVSRTGSPIKT